MSKRAIFVCILIPGTITFLVLMSRVTSFDDTGKAIALLALAILAATISASVAIARTPGLWGQKFDKAIGPKPLKRRWIWPLFMLILSIANFVLALAVLSGQAAFTPKIKASDGL